MLKRGERRKLMGELSEARHRQEVKEEVMDGRGERKGEEGRKGERG